VGSLLLLFDKVEGAIAAGFGGGFYLNEVSAAAAFGGALLAFARVRRTASPATHR
jgi:hypothetical protein